MEFSSSGCKLDKSWQNALLSDYNKYKWRIDDYFTGNWKFYLGHQKNYAERNQFFLSTTFAPLYDLGANERLKKLHVSTQTEFQQILLWSSDFKNYCNYYPNSDSTLADICMRCADMDKILDVLVVKQTS